MIPDFEDNGYLPPGIHRATLDEIEARFGSESELRRVQLESLRWLIELARRAGVERLVLNGSFVTDIIEPNDVDCVTLIGPDFPADPQAAKELMDGLPFLDLVSPARKRALNSSWFRAGFSGHWPAEYSAGFRAKNTRIGGSTGVRNPCGASLRYRPRRGP
jgi:hypothetical protein